MSSVTASSVRFSAFGKHDFVPKFLVEETMLARYFIKLTGKP